MSTRLGSKGYTQIRKNFTKFVLGPEDAYFDEAFRHACLPGNIVDRHFTDLEQCICLAEYGRQPGKRLGEAAAQAVFKDIMR